MKKYFILFLLPALAGQLHAQQADSTKRALHIQGLVNGRDLGGYPAAGGLHLKWGRLYRSAELGQLQAGGLDTLARLSIALVADFRGPAEVAKAPDRLPVTAKRISLPAGSEHTGDSSYMKEMMRVAADSGLVPFYSNIQPFRERYKPLFDALISISPDSAVLFHCTAGKDRTGIAAALLLSALGVDSAMIMQDYLATNYYRRFENEKAVRGMQILYHMDEKTARSLMEARSSYLLASFDAIKKSYGTVDNYLERVMGLDSAKRALLRAKYLEYAGCRPRQGNYML